MNQVSYWKGVPITELDRDELIEAIEYLGKEITRLETDRDRWFAAADPLKYLMDGQNNDRRV